MKEIIIQIDETLLKGLNNAVAAYGDIVFSLFLGCEVSDKYNKLKQLSDEEMQNRFKAVKNLYLQIEQELEK